MKCLLTIACIMVLRITAAQPANLAIQAGNQYFRQQQYAMAEDEYKKALAQEPANATARLNLAATQYKLGRQDEAIKAFEEIGATEKDPAVRARAAYNKGAILSKQKKLEESIEAYKYALRNDPADKEARENLQKALLELKKKEPPKKNDQQKKKQEQKQKQQQPKMNKKEAEQRLKLLEQKEREVQQRLQKEKSKTGGSQPKDW